MCIYIDTMYVSFSEWNPVVKWHMTISTFDMYIYTVYVFSFDMYVYMFIYR